MKISTYIFIISFFSLVFPGKVCLSQQITPKGTHLLVFYNNLGVEHLWQRGLSIDWETGKATGNNDTASARYGYAAEFVAAVCRKLKIKFPGPKDAVKGEKLVNTQFRWLKENGKKNGWSGSFRDVEAQRLANEGNLVIGIYPGKAPEEAGHIVIVRPAILEQEMIEVDGVQIIQAGVQNFTSTSAREGFRAFPEAFVNLKIKFYSHAVNVIP